jgi:hypothetical protein
MLLLEETHPAFQVQPVPHRPVDGGGEGEDGGRLLHPVLRGLHYHS